MISFAPPWLRCNRAPAHNQLQAPQRRPDLRVQQSLLRARKGLRRVRREVRRGRSTQPFPDNIVDVYPPGSLERLKAQAILVGLDRTFTLAKKYRIKVAFGTDILRSAKRAKDQGALLVMTTRWYSPVEALAMATGLGARRLALSGERDTYPGTLGVVEEGALADLLLVDGNPIENIRLVANPANDFVVIMKDGKVYKNTLPKGPWACPPTRAVAPDHPQPPWAPCRRPVNDGVGRHPPTVRTVLAQLPTTPRGGGHRVCEAPTGTSLGGRDRRIDRTS